MASSNASADWTQGSFLSDGKPVEEYHCVPSGEGPFPAVIIVHGLDALLTKAGRPHQIRIYPGAEHGFNFPLALSAFKPAAANDAFDRSIQFLGEWLKVPPTSRD
jgi:dienelactone hydrolase